MSDPAHEAWLMQLAPTRWHNRSVVAVIVVMLAGFAAIAPFAAQPMVALNTFFPTLDAVVFVTDLVTAVLLFGQFSISRSRALLVLASGYLFTACIVVPHALTFAGAFSPTGLLGANIQTGSWIFIFWHLGFAISLLGYALLRKWPGSYVTSDFTPVMIGWSVVAVFALVCAVTWLATSGATLLPPIVLDRSRIGPLVVYPIVFAILVSQAAVVLLAVRHGRSVLDQWLIVVGVASILELTFSGLLPTVRFSAGFYAGRVFSLLTSSIVLIALLAETTRLYVRLARSNALLQRERNNKLMNLEALAASIGHEIRQPLTAIIAFAEAARIFVRRNPPDLDDAAETLDDIIATGQRADQVFDNIRGLFGREQPRQPLDINELVLDVLHSLEFELGKNNIHTHVQLTSPLPAVNGNKGQLQEVIINLIHNATEAMGSTGGPRLLKLDTEATDRTVAIAIEDTGPGLTSQQMTTIFDAFVTTKPSGMGLGLAICRQIVERHEGSIHVSQASPHGAVFRVVLPAAVSPEA